VATTIALGVAPLLCVTALLLDVPGTQCGARMIGVVTLAWVLFRIIDIDAPRTQAGLALAGIVLTFGTTTAAPRRQQCLR
jgi:hypothetical protein